MAWYSLAELWIMCLFLFSCCTCICICCVTINDIELIELNWIEAQITLKNLSFCWYLRQTDFEIFGSATEQMTVSKLDLN